MATATAKIRSFDLQVSTYTAVGASCRVCMLIEHACRPQYTGTHVNSVDGPETPHRSEIDPQDPSETADRATTHFSSH